MPTSRHRVLHVTAGGRFRPRTGSVRYKFFHDYGRTGRQAGQGGGDSNGTVAQAAVRSGTPEEDLF